MPKGLGGYQPDTKAPSSRRADFDLQRRLAILERGGDGGGGEPGEAPNEVEVSTSAPTDPEVELWYDPDAFGQSGVELGFVHQQSVASAVWVIAHPLVFFPHVTVVDSAGDQVEGDVRYVSMDTVQVTFSSPFAGIAYLS